MSSDDAEVFDLACKELSNKHARDIMESIALGINTSMEIAEKLKISVQSVLVHLDTLEKIGLIERIRGESSGERGRLPRHYGLSKFAVLLIPGQIETENNKNLLNSLIKKKSLNLLKKRLTVSVLVGIVGAFGAFEFSLNPLQAYFAGPLLLHPSFPSVLAIVLASAISCSVASLLFFAAFRISRRLIR